MTIKAVKVMGHRRCVNIDVVEVLGRRRCVTIIVVEVLGGRRGIIKVAELLGAGGALLSK
jgi:hypothetical protein